MIPSTAVTVRLLYAGLAVLEDDLMQIKERIKSGCRQRVGLIPVLSLFDDLPAKIATRLVALHQRTQNHLFCSIRVGLDEQLPRSMIKLELKPRLGQIVEDHRPTMGHWRPLVVPYP